MKRSSISDWEKGKKIPSINHLTTLCNTLNIDLGYLLDIYDEDNAYIHSVSDITGLSEEASEVILSLSNDKIKLLDNILINDGFKLILNYLRDLIIPDNGVDRVLSEKYINDDLSEFQYSTIIRRYGDSRKICKYNASLQFGNLINELDDVFFEEKYGVTFDDIQLEFLDKFSPEELSKDKYEAFLNE